MAQRFTDAVYVAIGEQFVAECREIGGDNPTVDHVRQVHDSWLLRFPVGSGERAIAEHYLQYPDDDKLD